MRASTTALLALAVPAALALTACGSDGGDATTASGTRVAVDSGDDTCDLDATDLEAGSTTFAVTNTGSQVTEVYVYGADGEDFTKVVSEVENIGPGTSRDMVVDLGGGTYEVACKPGQSGDGIRTTITVSGDAAAPGSGSEEGYDREVELSTDGATLTGLDPKATTGERIEFKLTNDADTPRTLELKDPDGTVAGEVQDIEPGATGELVVELGSAGTWQVIVEGDGVEDITSELVVS